MSTSPTPAHARVLVVDDEPAILRALAKLLSKRGYEVVALASPLAAVRRLAQEAFDVALLDVRMPEIDGLELLRIVKRHHPDAEVIMMTGHATEEALRAAADAGAFGCLTKPFETVEEVAHTVLEAAARRRRRAGPRDGTPGPRTE